MTNCKFIGLVSKNQLNKHLIAVYLQINSKTMKLDNLY